MKYVNNLPPFTLYLKLVPKRHRSLVISYAKWLYLLSLRGINQKPINQNSFNLLCRAMNRQWQTSYLLGQLQSYFIKENLSLSLLQEPLDGFYWLSKNQYVLSYSSSSPIIMNIIAPVSRLIAVLNNQFPHLYQPLSNLIFIHLSLFILNSEALKELLSHKNITLDSENLVKSLPLIFIEAKQILPHAHGLIFKLKIAYFLGLSHILIKKSHKHTKKNPDLLDYFNAFLYATWYILTIKNKPIKLNQI